MSWSLNEVEGLARKAARGSGLSWGLAEEAGKSTRWLTAAGLPGPTSLAGLLSQNDGLHYGALCPVDTDGDWEAENGALCPLISGAVICDHAARIAGGEPIRLKQTSFPMLLLPFAAGAANLTETPMEITWSGCTVTLGPEGEVDMKEASELETTRTDTVEIRAVSNGLCAPQAAVSRCDIPADVVAVLGAFAHRTYAPDTPESRLAGAGAGLTDND